MQIRDSFLNVFSFSWAVDWVLVGHTASAIVAVFVHLRVCLRSPDKSQHHVHHKRSETCVCLQQYHPWPVHADIFVFRQQRDICHIQLGVRRGRERRDFFWSTSWHCGSSTKPRRSTTRHKRNDRVLLHKHLTLYRRTNHVSAGSLCTYTVQRCFRFKPL